MDAFEFYERLQQRCLNQVKKDADYPCGQCCFAKFYRTPTFNSSVDLVNEAVEFLEGKRVKDKVKKVMIADVKTALEIYSKYGELSNNEIKILYNNNAKSTVARLMREAKAQMKKDGKISSRSYLVDTESAYKAWNIDVKRLERLFNMQKRLGFTTEGGTTDE